MEGLHRIDKLYILENDEHGPMLYAKLFESEDLVEEREDLIEEVIHPEEDFFVEPNNESQEEFEASERTGPSEEV